MKKTYTDKSNIHGIGLFASEPIKPGDLIFTVSGALHLVKDFDLLPKSLKKASDDWVGISRYRYIDTKASPIRFINHSCEPNAALRTPRRLIAMKAIAAGEEITMDYSLTEAGQDYHRPCSCKTPSCRGIITPINLLPSSLVRKRLPFISKNFLRTYCAMNKINYNHGRPFLPQS